MGGSWGLPVTQQEPFCPHLAASPQHPRHFTGGSTTKSRFFSWLCQMQLPELLEGGQAELERADSKGPVEAESWPCHCSLCDWEQKGTIVSLSFPFSPSHRVGLSFKE